MNATKKKEKTFFHETLDRKMHAVNNKNSKNAVNMMEKMRAQNWSNKIAQETIEVIELSHSIAVNDGIPVMHCAKYRSQNFIISTGY